MQALDFEKIVKRICAETKKTDSEVKELVEAKKEKFSGLLTDAGAAFIVAKELGLELDVKNSFSERKQISELTDGMKNVDVLCRVKQVFVEREFEKDGKKGKLRNLIVEDASGETRLTVWSRQVDELNNVQKGSLLLLKNAYTTSFREKVQLNIGFAGQIVFNPNEKIEGLQEIEKNEKKLSELEEGMDNVDVYFRILNIFPLKTFEKKDGIGKVINFQIADGTKVMRAAAWNDMAEKINELNEGTAVKVEGAYVKRGRDGLELQLGWNARIIKEPKEANLPPLEELREEKFEKKAISELNKYDNTVEITGKIIAVRKGKLHYLVCPKCNKKVQEVGTGYVCDNCGEVQKPGINPVITIVVDDGKGVIQSTFFGRQAERIMKKKTEELKKELQEKQVEEIIKNIENNISGNEITVIGNVQENSLNPDELEFIGREIIEIKEKKIKAEEFSGNEVSEYI